MQLTDEQIKEFQRIYLETYGESIDQVAAQKMGKNLIHLVELVYRPRLNELNEG